MRYIKLHMTRHHGDRFHRTVYIPIQNVDSIKEETTDIKKDAKGHKYSYRRTTVYTMKSYDEDEDAGYRVTEDADAVLDKIEKAEMGVDDDDDGIDDEEEDLEPYHLGWGVEDDE